MNYPDTWTTPIVEELDIGGGTETRPNGDDGPVGVGLDPDQTS